MDKDVALLYVLAWTQSQISRELQPSRFLHDVAANIENGYLNPTAVEDIIFALKRGENCGNEQLFFEWDANSLYINVLDYRRLFPFPPEAMIDELEKLLQSYQKAKSQGVSVEKGLMSYLGHTRQAQLVILKILVCSQSIDTTVKGCWQIFASGFGLGIPSGQIHPEDLAETVNEFHSTINAGGWYDFANLNEPLSIEIVDDRVQVTSFRDSRESCPRYVFLNELDKLLERYYEAI